MAKAHYDSDIPSFQKSLLDAIQGGEPQLLKFDLEPCGSLSSPEALGIYQNNYYQNLKDSLKDTYEACYQLLSEELFSAIAFEFISQNPHHCHHLSGYGKNFPQFLKELKPDLQEIFPFLPQLASLEKLIQELFIEGALEKSMEITYPIHQIWTSLLFDGEEREIVDLPRKCLLSIEREREEETLSFQVSEI